MFQACGGMFGVMPFYHSSIVHQKENLPATNHLFLVDAKFWTLYTSSSHDTPDFRVLVRHLSEFVGDPLSCVSEPQQLFVCIAHAALGYRHLIERGFHHRDISMGNILWSKDAKRTRSAHETLDGDLTTESQKRLHSQFVQSEIRDHCHGFVIDGDLAIELEPYFTEDRTNTQSRSGTDEFMSRQMLHAAIVNKPYLQSPVDDLNSFYYVAQWAAVNNNTDFPDSTTPIPDELRFLRKCLAGSLADRELGTSTITSEPLDSASYGTFLPHCQLMLQEWHQTLVVLTKDWHVAKSVTPETAHQYDTYYPRFREFTNRGVLELVELVQKHFPGSLKGQA